MLTQGSEHSVRPIQRNTRLWNMGYTDLQSSQECYRNIQVHKVSEEYFRRHNKFLAHKKRTASKNPRRGHACLQDTSFLD